MKTCSANWSADARLVGMLASGGPPRRGLITALRALGAQRGARMGNLLFFWLGIGSSAKRRSAPNNCSLTPMAPLEPRPITTSPAVTSAASLLADQQEKHSDSYQQCNQNTDEPACERYPHLAWVGGLPTSRPPLAAARMAWLLPDCRHPASPMSMSSGSARQMFGEE